MATEQAHLDTQRWSPDKLMNYDGITNYSTLKLNNISLLDLLDNHEVTQILARHRIWIFFFWITFVVGMGGNWLVVYVLMRTKQMRTVTNTYLLNLAIVDILYLVTTIPRTSYWTDYWPFGEFMCKLIIHLKTNVQVKSGRRVDSDGDIVVLTCIVYII